MKKLVFLFLSLLLLSCHGLESESTLAPADVAFIRAAGLLAPGETIRCFYANTTKGLDFGSFVTNQRIGHYWPADPRSSRYECESALYSDIEELKVVHEPELVHSPYVGVHKRGQRYGFMVRVSGSHAEVQQFYDEAFCLWQRHRHGTK